MHEIMMIFSFVGSVSDGETTIHTRQELGSNAIPALAGVLGVAVIIITILSVVLGFVWHYQRKLRKTVCTYVCEINTQLKNMKGHGKLLDAVHLSEIQYTAF